jgi:predicted O-methyltransferase YrrM
MELIAANIEQYISIFSSPLDPVLQELEQFTQVHHPQAHMLSGQVQGKLLEFFSRMMRPSAILEIGTFTGFSALCLAKGLAEGGVLHTIECREADAKTALGFFEKAGLQHQIRLHQGFAADIIPTLNQSWDLVFLDADKTGYIEYYELTLPMLKPGGWIIADNVLFHGEVLQPVLKGKNAKAVQAFNEHVAQDDRVEQVILSLRDGLTVIRKK